MESVYQFKVSLEDIQPPIWRRFQISSSSTFRELHATLQVVMGWRNKHLYLFDLGSLIITRGKTLEHWGENGVRDDIVQIDEYLGKEGISFIYEYDLEDNWRHELILEKILFVNESTVYPRVIDGARCCPPENCGGIHGYKKMLNAVLAPGNPEHEPFLSLAGGSFDPEQFELAIVNQQLRNGVYWEGKLIAAPLTSTQIFTPLAQLFWDSIPQNFQLQLIDGVSCSTCKKLTVIVNFHGTIVNGNLMLHGQCNHCGSRVSRLIEGR